ncbi:glycosyltransferase family 39 protein [Couchioplanes azureus]|uniref:glycosyltransferase family 39 protein n=1 Tax=Couchioplanes caeruleus TaxID=56438 RepID=UPI0016705DF5|nr:glycosyltransferase family 39 protein [Couchioplanes caeruleus]GGQ42848.1 hypothetical protein GCM10010166_08810 [Couchioplanes caeruleus subsp. azureus]
MQSPPVVETWTGLPAGSDVAVPGGAEAPGVTLPPSRGERLWRWAPALGPGLLMLVVAMVGATGPVLSWDEVATADTAGRSAAQIGLLARSIDAVFAPYYLFMHLWTAVLGATDLTLRLPSVIAMSGVVALTGELGRRLFGPFTGMVAALLLGSMPNISRYAAEARPYAFAMFFALLALLLLRRQLQRPGPGRWIGYVTAVLLVGLSHVVALTTLAAHVAMLLARRRDAGFRRIVLRWVVAGGVAVLLLLPLLWLGLHQRDDQLHWLAEPTLRSLRAFPGEVAGSEPGAWLLVGLALVALCRPVRHAGPLLVLTLVPIAVVFALSSLGAPMWVPRYLLIVLPPLALLAAAGLRHASPRRTTGARRDAIVLGGRTLAVLLLLAFVVLPDQRRVRKPFAKSGQDYRGAAAIMARDGQPGDVLVYPPRSRHFRAGLDHYLSRVPQRPRDVLMARSAAEVGSLRAEEHRDAAARVRGTARVWLLAYDRPPDPATGRPDLRPLLATEYRQARIWYLDHATLALYVHRDAAV